MGKSKKIISHLIELFFMVIWVCIISFMLTCFAYNISRPELTELQVIKEVWNQLTQEL